jgi:hypothetical protein
MKHLIELYGDLSNMIDRVIKRTLTVLTFVIVLISVIAVIAIVKSLYLVLAQCIIVSIILVPTIISLQKSKNN